MYACRVLCYIGIFPSVSVLYNGRRLHSPLSFIMNEWGVMPMNDINVTLLLLIVLVILLMQIKK